MMKSNRTLYPAAAAAAIVTAAAHPALALALPAIPEPSGVAIFAIGAAVVALAIRFARRR
jgi:hypothetical protein